MTTRTAAWSAATAALALLSGLTAAGVMGHEGHGVSALHYGRRPSPGWFEMAAAHLGAPDLRALSARIVDREEWDLVVLMSEVHGDVDPWSIVGCRMGLRALDLLRAPMQSVAVVSQAGALPPLGRLTDGLLAGTGATVGRGLLRLADGPARPAATFVHGDRAVRLQAHAFVADAIRDSLAAIAAATGGAGSADYATRVRAFSLWAWAAWGRDEMFAEQWVPAP